GRPRTGPLLLLLEVGARLGLADARERRRRGRGAALALLVVIGLGFLLLLVAAHLTFRHDTPPDRPLCGLAASILTPLLGAGQKHLWCAWRQGAVDVAGAAFGTARLNRRVALEHGMLPDLVTFAGERRFATILADPPWQFANKTRKDRARAPT